ncbi:MAG: hypothetical protein ACI9MC_000302 [Kiritimatiellia bacterium]|jgi:hypothetical protein
MLCSESSQRSGEHIDGTALDRMVHWIAIEDHGSRPSKVTMKTDLAPGVLDWFIRMKGRPHTRPVLIRRRDRPTGFTVFYARVDVGHLQTFHLDRQEQLLDIDWHALMTQPLGATAELGPLLVCTHGSRDSCCGRLAPPVLNALEHVGPGRIWQSTHIGGHRYAPTLIALPSGLQFGRVTAREAPDLLVQLDAGRIHNLAMLRGATALPRAAQAAQIWLRRERALLGLTDVIVRHVQHGGSERDDTIVTLHTPGDGRDHSVLVKLVDEPFSVLASCSKSPKTAQRWVVERRNE